MYLIDYHNCKMDRDVKCLGTSGNLDCDIMEIKFRIIFYNLYIFSNMVNVQWSPVPLTNNGQYNELKDSLQFKFAVWLSQCTR